jgi:hypothetical protein
VQQGYKMKKLIQLIGALFLSCIVIYNVPAQKVLSLSPLFSESDVVLEQTVEGTWSFEIFGKDSLRLQPMGDNFYHLLIPARSTGSRFEAVFTRVEDILMMDLLPIVPDSIGNTFYREHQIQLHSWYHVKINGDTLRIADMNYRWFYDNIVAKQSSLQFSWSGTTPFLTMPTNELRKFIGEHANEPGFFKDDIILHRIVSKNQGDPTTRRFQPEVTHKKIDSISLLQRCNPAFPYKEGWLGGDGDISLPLDSSHTLWIFGDTFVGEKNQKDRSGAKMVSNTVALLTCESNGKSTIEYFWRNPYTNHPGPFFDSFTDRYKYWPCAAFMSRNNLYVPLLKIGPKSPVQPDDIFNFKGVGMSLAKISDPNSTRPDKWDIQLFPWSHILDPDLWGCSAVDGDYLYLFTKEKNQTVILSRISLKDLESHGNRTEYYGIDEEWKTSLPPDDRKVLFSGDAGNSVSYYQDLKQWIMVCGPGFTINKIRIRIAPALTGPWSEERIIYECPEQTTGSKTFDKDNFCYSGRDHNEFYNRESHSLLITYDCNVALPSKLLLNTGIYSTRVLSIPLEK